MKKLVYSPQPDITLYELAMVMKVFTYGTLPFELKTVDVLFGLYESLPKEAQRHFTIITEKTK